MYRKIPLYLLLLLAAACGAPTAATAQDVPAGFEQLLPRGRLAAIDKPTYVAAEKAKINDASVVFGLVIDKQPLAFSLNLLNAHEVVNDTVGKTNFAAVW